MKGPILGPICCALKRKQRIWEEARTHANPLTISLESARLGLNYKTLREIHRHRLIVECLFVGMKNWIKKPTNYGKTRRLVRKERQTLPYFSLGY